MTYRKKEYSPQIKELILGEIESGVMWNEVCKKYGVSPLQIKQWKDEKVGKSLSNGAKPEVSFESERVAVLLERIAIANERMATELNRLANAWEAK